MFRKIVFLVVIALFNNNCDAQNLTLDQVLNLRTKELSYVDEYLTTKKWSMLSAEEPTDENMGNISFAYNKGIYDDKAESFIDFYYSSISNSYNRIKIQVNKSSNYNIYIARIKALGYKLQKSFVEDGDLVKIYQSSNTTIKVSTSTQKDDFTSTKTTHSFFILTTTSYNLNYND
jgi:hypothetical protein